MYRLSLLLLTLGLALAASVVEARAQTSKKNSVRKPASGPSKPVPKKTTKPAAAASKKTPSKKKVPSKKTTSGKRTNRGRSSRSSRATQQAPTKDRYREIQQALVEKGYLDKQADGSWGSDSVEALKRFQADQNLKPDGRLDSLSLIALGLGPKRSVVGESGGEQ